MDFFKTPPNYYETSPLITGVPSFRLFAQPLVIIRVLKILHISFWPLRISSSVRYASRCAIFKPPLSALQIIYNR